MCIQNLAREKIHAKGVIIIASRSCQDYCVSTLCNLIRYGNCLHASLAINVGSTNLQPRCGVIPSNFLCPTSVIRRLSLSVLQDLDRGLSRRLNYGSIELSRILQVLQRARPTREPRTMIGRRESRGILGMEEVTRLTIERGCVNSNP